MKKMIIVLLVIIGITMLYNLVKDKKNHERENVKIPVLLYHNFVITVPESDSDNFNYINTPQSFEENIKTIIENGYTIISLQELNDMNKGKINIPEKPIVITFDDGYYSNYEYIYPILKKYNVKVSIFIVTDKIQKEIDGIKYLGWEECREMQNSGLVEIFSHSKRHIFYHKVPIQEIRNDVIESYEIIEKNLGKKDFKAFAYPYGAYTSQTVKILRNSGIKMQLYDLGINNFKNFDEDYVKRINIPCDMTGKEIIEEIEK